MTFFSPACNRIFSMLYRLNLSLLVPTMTFSTPSLEVYEFVVPGNCCRDLISIQLFNTEWVWYIQVAVS